MAAIAMSYTRNRTPEPKVVIMDGGGNDILQNPGCAPGCAEEVHAVSDARNFLKQMAMDGVKDVVFIFYYDMPSMKAGLDWMRPKMLAECQQSPVPCHFVDNQPLFAGKDASTYTTDGIHPNKEAARRLLETAAARSDRLVTDVRGAAGDPAPLHRDQPSQGDPAGVRPAARGRRRDAALRAGRRCARQVGRARRVRPVGATRCTSR
jgi:hypothetical protein